MALLSGIFSAFHNVRLVVVLVMALSLLMAIHVREQFSDSRARLIPGFARVHITVAVCAALALAVLLPAIFAWMADWSYVGFLAITVFVSSTILWAGLFGRMGLALAFIVFYVGVAASDDGIDLIKRALDNLISGRSAGVATVLFVFGATMVFLAWNRLVCFHEEMVGYDAPVQTGARGRRTTGMNSLRKSKLLRMLEAWLNEEREMTRLVRHASKASMSGWSRVCRWQVGTITTQRAWLWSLCAVLAVQLLVWTVNRWTKLDAAPLFLLTSLCWLILVPAMSLGQLVQRTRTVRYELFMPVERGTYLRQAGLATLLAQLQLWNAACVATLLWWLAAVRQTVGLADVTSILALSVVIQVLLFGIALWLARYRFLLWLGIILAYPAMILMVPAVAGIVEGTSWLADWRYVACSIAVAILTMLSVIMVWAAYRRWLVADFD